MLSKWLPANTATSVLMKCSEKLIKSHILNQLQHLLNPFQSAHQSAGGRNSDFVKLVLQTLGKSRCHERTLLDDCWSTVNRIDKSTCPSFQSYILHPEFSNKQNRTSESRWKVVRSDTHQHKVSRKPHSQYSHSFIDQRLYQSAFKQASWGRCSFTHWLYFKKSQQRLSI